MLYNIYISLSKLKQNPNKLITVINNNYINMIFFNNILNLQLSLHLTFFTNTIHDKKSISTISNIVNIRKALYKQIKHFHRQFNTW